MTGKGSSPRPKSVSDEDFGKRFDAIDWSDRSREIEGRPISGDEPLDYPQPGTPIWSER